DGPKFPEVPKLMLLANWVFTHDVEAESERVRSRIAEVDQALQLTLQRMAQGGMRDHIGGGFHRYSVDREWRVPHFEKMLYDQALLAMLYIDEFGRTDNPLYWQVATETLAFVQRELSAPDGGFYSSLDAETEGVEGQYYVWSREEIGALLGDNEGTRLFAAAYGLDEDSRFEHGHVLFNPKPLEEIANDRGLSLQELDVRLTGSRLPLLLERGKRPALRRDEKVLASWNGLMIAAFAKAAFWEPMPELAAKYANTAEQAANFVLNNMRDDEGRLLHCYAGGKAGIQPYLDDYAYVIWGLRELAEATQENATSDWQQIARELQDQQNEMFRDERGHGYFYTADAHEPLLARAKDSNDSVMPSANAVSVINLDDLSRWPGVPEYSDLARQSLEVFAPALSKSPALLASTADALRAYLIRPRNSDLPDNGAASTQPANDQLALAGGEELVPTAEASVEDARKHDKLSAAVYLSVDKVPAGGECNVAVVLNVKEGWHINANPAQPKFLIPTELTAALPAEFELTDVRYPDGEEFMQQGADEPLVVYEGKVVLYGKLKAPASAAGKSANSEFTVRYQCCNDSECLRPMKLLLKGQFAIAAQGEQPQAINQSLFKPKRPQPQ
ncbi:MAG: hypothetical protein JNG89_00615, partial [Planctomycetaceae bacterium]|nr:hypothetical protein [Planctomycetaceae bacterium]